MYKIKQFTPKSILKTQKRKNTNKTKQNAK